MRFRKAGVPEGVFHVLPGGVEAEQALVADPHVRVLSFTGSTAAGRKVGEAAARHLERAHLELGGTEIADRLSSGIVHINDQTVEDEAVVPFGGVGHFGTGARFGGTRANLDAFTETQWITIRADPAPHPF